MSVWLLAVCRVSEAVSSCPSSSCSSVVSSHQQVESSRSDVAEMTETKLLSSLPNTSVDNLSPWQHSSINGSLSVLRHHQNSPDHSPLRMHRPDPSPYHVRTIDRSPLRQQQTAAARSTVFAHCPLASGRSASIWQTGHASLQHSNGLSVPDNERMDVWMDEMPLNLCTTQQLTNVDSRRRILTSGKKLVNTVMCLVTSVCLWCLSFYLWKHAASSVIWYAVHRQSIWVKVIGRGQGHKEWKNLSVYPVQAQTFEYLDLQTSFLVYR